MPGYDQLNVTGFDYNPDTARTLLKKAGYNGELVKLVVANGLLISKP